MQSTFVWQGWLISSSHETFFFFATYSSCFDSRAIDFAFAARGAEWDVGVLVAGAPAAGPDAAGSAADATPRKSVIIFNMLDWLFEDEALSDLRSPLMALITGLDLRYRPGIQQLK